MSSAFIRLYLDLLLDCSVCKYRMRDKRLEFWWAPDDKWCDSIHNDALEW